MSEFNRCDSVFCLTGCCPGGCLGRRPEALFCLYTAVVALQSISAAVSPHAFLVWVACYGC